MMELPKCCCPGHIPNGCVCVCIVDSAKDSRLLVSLPVMFLHKVLVTWRTATPNEKSLSICINSIYFVRNVLLNAEWRFGGANDCSQSTCHRERSKIKLNEFSKNVDLVERSFGDFRLRDHITKYKANRIFRNEELLLFHFEHLEIQLILAHRVHRIAFVFDVILGGSQYKFCIASTKFAPPRRPPPALFFAPEVFKR